MLPTFDPFPSNLTSATQCQSHHKGKEFPHPRRLLGPPLALKPLIQASVPAFHEKSQFNVGLLSIGKSMDSSLKPPFDQLVYLHVPGLSVKSSSSDAPDSKTKSDIFTSQACESRTDYLTFSAPKLTVMSPLFRPVSSDNIIQSRLIQD